MKYVKVMKVRNRHKIILHIPQQDFYKHFNIYLNCTNLPCGTFIFYKLCFCVYHLINYNNYFAGLCNDLHIHNNYQQ